MEALGLKEYLKEKGATLVGVGDVSEALTEEIAHLDRGIAIAVNRSLNRTTVDLLSRLQDLSEGWLRERGFRALAIPPDSDRVSGTFISRLYKLFSHKVAATCSGLGWVGKNGLVINGEYGSKLTWATVLTDAPLVVDAPSNASRCGDCDLCVKHCPSGAIKGRIWSSREPLREMVSYEKCRSLKKDRLLLDGKPNCGLCITICPYSRNDRQKAESCGVCVGSR